MIFRVFPFRDYLRYNTAAAGDGVETFIAHVDGSTCEKLIKEPRKFGGHGFAGSSALNISASIQDPQFAILRRLTTGEMISSLSASYIVDAMNADRLV